MEGNTQIKANIKPTRNTKAVPLMSNYGLMFTSNIFTNYLSNTFLTSRKTLSTKNPKIRYR